MDDAESTAEDTATTTDENVSEDENQSDTENTSKGDLRVPLKQTREELRQLKEQLDDPNFIYEQAKRHGLAQEETLQPEDQTQAPDVQKMVRDQIEVEKAYDKYPELRTDVDLRFMVAGLINRGLSPMKAADKTFAKIKEANERVAKEAQDEEDKAVKAQQSAQTVETTTSKDSEGSEYERQYKLSKSPDPRVQRKAMIALEILKAKK